MAGDYLKALNDFDEAIRLNPQFALAYSHRGCVYRKLQEFRKAVSDFTEAIHLTRTPGLLRESHQLRGSCFRTIGDNVRAMDDFIEAMRFNIEMMDPYLWRNDYYTQVLMLSADTIEQEDKPAKSYYARGCIHYKKGDFEKTVDDCTQAIIFDDKSPFAYVLRAMAYEKMNDNPEAAADYSKARELIGKLTEQREWRRPFSD